MRSKVNKKSPMNLYGNNENPLGWGPYLADSSRIMFHDQATPTFPSVISVWRQHMLPPRFFSVMLWMGKIQAAPDCNHG